MLRYTLKYKFQYFRRNYTDDRSYAESSKKLILFFSKGGGGHVSGAEAINEYLNGHDQIKRYF